MILSSDILGLALSAFGIGVILYGPWQKACTDYIRQPLFENRDALFELARIGSIAFDNPAYIATRAMINGSVRYAHITSLPRVFFHHWAGTMSLAPAKPELLSLIDAIEDEGVKEQLRSIVISCSVVLVKLMIMKSPALWLIVLLASPLLLVVTALGSLGSVLRAFTRSVGEIIQDEVVLADQANVMMTA